MTGAASRYLVSADGMKIIEERQMQKTALESCGRETARHGRRISHHGFTDVPADRIPQRVNVLQPKIRQYRR